ncbi:MAG: hypothetical protein K6B64_00915 [Acholeplasmatales bacterium]|nr:hypothetical protein [Acholeplasmatales bacterium]
MKLFRPRSANEKNYKKLELDLYLNLVTLQKLAQEDTQEPKYYFISPSDKVYRQGYKLCYSLVKFYTKNREEKKEYQFKRNYLLSKTRGLYSNQKKKQSNLYEAYLVKKELIDALADDYYKMFKIEKAYDEVKKEEKGTD